MTWLWSFMINELFLGGLEYMNRLMTKQTKWLCPAKTLISRASVQSDQSLRCALNGYPSFLHADSEESDQTWRMPRLIWVFAGRTGRFVGFVMRRLIYINYCSWTDSIKLESEIFVSCVISLRPKSPVPFIKWFYCIWHSCDIQFWAASRQNQQNDCAPSEDSDQPGQTLIRLGVWPGWSDSSLGAHAILLVLSWGGSFYFSGVWIYDVLNTSSSQTKILSKKIG